MGAAFRVFDVGSRATAYTLGGLVLVVAVAATLTSLSPSDIAVWAENVFGITFLCFMGGLIFAAVFCWAKAIQSPADRVWLTAGLQVSNAIVTLALTYTLLGISLGVGGLAEQELTPETVREVVRGLTEKFSLAFLTTVVGLPTSAVLRILFVVTEARNQQRGAVVGTFCKGETR